MSERRDAIIKHALSIGGLLLVIGIVVVHGLSTVTGAFNRESARVAAKVVTRELDRLGHRLSTNSPYAEASGGRLSFDGERNDGGDGFHMNCRITGWRDATQGNAFETLVQLNIQWAEDEVHIRIDGGELSKDWAREIQLALRAAGIVAQVE